MTIRRPNRPPITRRSFLTKAGMTLLATGLASTSGRGARAAELGQVKKRSLGKTGLMLSEVGFGGHSWEYPRVPDGDDWRQVSEDEAVEMISVALDMGVNFFDADTAVREHEIPARTLKRLGRADEAYVCIRLCHKMKGQEQDKQEIYSFLDERLKLWPRDYVDIMMVSMVTEEYWDMSYAIEAFDKVKQEGKVRFTGFGSHFTPENYIEAIGKYGAAFDICSMPYNVRHTAAEEIFPVAEEHNLGIVTIKPFARGSLLNDRDLEGADKGLPREMVRFVLDSEYVDCCLTGVHTLAQMTENFSASWTETTDEARSALRRLALRADCGDQGWLDRGWLRT